MASETTINKFPTTISELWDEMERIAVNLGDWAVYCPDQYTFLQRAGDRRYRQKYYHQFSIPKKSGGVRTITAPTGFLKGAQRAVATLLKKVYSPPSAVNGFTDGKSVKTNAERHVGKHYVFNADLKDYFPSITRDMVFKALLHHGVTDVVAGYIATVCTITTEGEDLPEDVLPQGSPASPILSNMVCYQMDIQLEWLARRTGLTYSRYADDITFSSQYSVYSKNGDFLRDFKRIVSGFGFTLNDAKTRLQKHGSRQEVTGITVGDKVNISRKYLKNLRSEIFQMEMYGFSREQYRSASGKVAFVGFIRGVDDPLFTKLKARIRSIKHNPRGFLASR